MWVFKEDAAMKKARFIGLVTAILFVLAAGTAMAEVPSNQKIPFNDSFFVPCANGGRGEMVRLAGEMHALFLITFDENGGRHVASQFQPMGITGYGEETGDTYRASGVTRHNLNIRDATFPVAYTLVNNFRLVGPGQGNNVIVHDTYHITVNANGEVSAGILISWGECK
jgi:hypothetical protein